MFFFLKTRIARTPFQFTRKYFPQTMKTVLIIRQFDEIDIAIEEYTFAIEKDDRQPLFYEARAALYADERNRPDDALVDYQLAAALYGETNVPTALKEKIQQLGS